MKNNKYVKILKIIPINYNLKSDLEKEAILNSYKIFLKTCNFNIQILIQSSKENLDKNILNIQKNIQKKENKFLKNISNEYIKYIQNMNLSKKSSSKNFYIILSNEKLKGIDYNQSFEIIKNSTILQTKWNSYSKKFEYAKDITFEDIMKSINDIINDLI